MVEPSWTWMNTHTEQESHLISAFLVFSCPWTQAEWQKAPMGTFNLAAPNLGVNFRAKSPVPARWD